MLQTRRVCGTLVILEPIQVLEITRKHCKQFERKLKLQQIFQFTILCIYLSSFMCVYRAGKALIIFKSKFIYVLHLNLGRSYYRKKNGIQFSFYQLFSFLSLEYQLFELRGLRLYEHFQTNNRKRVRERKPAKQIQLN